MMGRLAADVGVLTGRQVQPFDGTDLRQDIERPEDRGAPDPETPFPRRDDQLGGREVAVLIGDERREGAPRLGQPVAGAVERGHDRGRVGHA